MTEEANSEDANKHGPGLLSYMTGHLQLKHPFPGMSE